MRRRRRARTRLFVLMRVFTIWHIRCARAWYACVVRKCNFDCFYFVLNVYYNNLLLMSMPIILLLRNTLDSIIDAQQTNSRLIRALQAPNLADRRLQHTRGNVIPHLAIQ